MNRDWSRYKSITRCIKSKDLPGSLTYKILYTFLNNTRISIEILLHRYETCALKNSYF